MGSIVRPEKRRAGRIPLLALASVLTLLLLAGCSRKEASAPEARPATNAATTESAAPATTEPTAAEPMPGTIQSAPTTSAIPPRAKTPPPPAPERAQGLLDAPGKSATPSSPSPTRPSDPQPAASEPSPAPAAVPAPPEKAASKVDDPGGTVAVASTHASATRIGPEKCKICHKLQFASWSEGPHARRSPPLDCENCHGPGSEYKTLATMKDREKARAAGLVLPDAKFCATCHKRDWKSDMLSKAHAHKAKA